MERARLHGGVVTAELLPELVDAKRLQAELGITRAASEAIMRELPGVAFPGLRKTYVKRRDVARLIDAHTFGKTEVQA